MSRERHALVVGGSGMLSGVSLTLARTFHAVTVVARSSRRLESLAQASNGVIRTAALDYRDTEALVSTLRAAQYQQGPFDLAVCWIHSVAPHALQGVADTLPEGAELLHVCGSAVADPSGRAPKPPAPRRDIIYRRVILGFVVDTNGRSRWLTKREIVTGVLKATRSRNRLSVVGTVTPWSARP